MSPAALSPPRRFRGRFSTTLASRSPYSEAAGPVRMLPEAAATPEDTEDLSALVRWAGEQGATLVPRGAATGMPGGNVGPGVIVDLTGLRRIGAVDRQRRLIRVQAGTVAQDLAEAAREVGLRLPPLPSSADRCTVGGMVANNAAGARTFGHGAIRDWVQEVSVVLADGEPAVLGPGSSPPAFRRLHADLADRVGSTPARWPAVRKNASGYALDRFLPTANAVELFTGSEGTLGIATELCLHLEPIPPETALALLPLPDLGALVGATTAAGAGRASACEFFGRRFIDISGLRHDPGLGGFVRDADALLLVELEGDRCAVERSLESLRSFAAHEGLPLREARSAEEKGQLWEVRHAASPVIAREAEEGRVSMQFIEDSVVPPERLEDYLRQLQGILTAQETDAVVFGHAGDGNVHVNPLVDVRRRDWRDRVRRILYGTADLVRSLGGTLSGEHGDGRIRSPLLDRVWPPSLADAFRTVKGTLDPDGVLNPGVVVPLEGQDPLEGMAPSPKGA